MANYSIAYQLIIKNEGGYVNDPSDNGGETYKGISRRFWPGWAGWTIIDSQKAVFGFPGNLKSNAYLDGLVFSFYKTNFWDRLSGDTIRSQRIANEICDSAVNFGVMAGIKFAQKICGLAQTGFVDAVLINKLNSLL